LQLGELALNTYDGKLYTKKDNGTASIVEIGGGSGGVTAVSGTAPITSTGGTTPAIGISAATTSAAGSMSSADKTKLDGIQAGAQVNVATNLGYTDATRALTSSTGTGVTLPLVTSSAPGLAPASGGGTTNFLRADGSWAAPGGGGGGGLTQFQESKSTASPNATTPVDALTATDASYSNIDVALVAKGTGATLAQVPDGTMAGGNKRGNYATDLQKQRSNSSQVASGINSSIVGGANNQNSSDYGFIGGGSDNLAQTSGAATICGGTNHTSTGYASFVGAGTSNYCSANRGAIVGGANNIAAGYASFIGGGYTNRADADYSCIPGGAYGTDRNIVGNFVIAACLDPLLSYTRGTCQSARVILGGKTSSATPLVLTSNGYSAYFNNQIYLGGYANSAYSFAGDIIAGVTGAGNTARWAFSGAVKRGASGSNPVFVGTPTITKTHSDSGASTWAVAFSIDTTYQCISVTVTGQASTNIRWVCTFDTTEMTF
jgi:hypothetical protein